MLFFKQKHKQARIKTTKTSSKDSQLWKELKATQHIKTVRLLGYLYL